MLEKHDNEAANEGGTKYNYDIAHHMLPVAMWAHIVLTFGRVLLVLISLKRPQVCKVFFNYDLVLLLVNECLVKEVGSEAENYIMLLLYFIFVFTTHLDFWPSFVGTFLS